MPHDNQPNFTHINIETLLLVAIWKHPFIFQGYFNITEKTNPCAQVLFFKCEYVKTACIDTVDDEFSPDEYMFSYLYNEERSIDLNSLRQHNDDALYLLKYALHTTLLLMLKNQKQGLVSIDEIAAQSIVEMCKPIFCQRALQAQKEYDIGFAVAMDFVPSEAAGQSAALVLLGK